MSKAEAKKNLAKDVETTRLPQQPPDNRTALRFLDSMVALSPISRQQHISAQAAIQQLSMAIGELERLKMEKIQDEKQKA